MTVEFWQYCDWNNVEQRYGGVGEEAGDRSNSQGVEDAVRAARMERHVSASTPLRRPWPVWASCTPGSRHDR